MFDSRLRPLIDPVSNRLGLGLVHFGVTANMVTVTGGVFGVMACLALCLQSYNLALVFIVLNRIFDGLDGAVARHQGITDLGGYLDIVIDFIFYAIIPMGFAIGNPDYALPAAVLITSFVGTGSSFLAFAIMAEKRGISTDIRGRKSLYYLGGLTEGFETIVALILMCIWPEYFPVIAYVFAGLCWITTATRIYWAVKTCRD
jgi:phosphatidylglycerophosphate synthase